MLLAVVVLVVWVVWAVVAACLEAPLIPHTILPRNRIPAHTTRTRLRRTSLSASKYGPFSTWKQAINNLKTLGSQGQRYAVGQEV